MRKVGTISSAVGFIFLGIWMIVNQRNASLATKIFEWWPVIIIILGIEILVSFHNTEEGYRIRLNGMIIPVVILFLFVNVFINVKANINGGIRWVKNNNSLNNAVDKLTEIDGIGDNIKSNIDEGINWLKNNNNLNNVVDKLAEIDDLGYKVIESSKIVDVYGKIFVLESNNGDIDIKTSNDNKIRIDTKIYVNKNSEQSLYNIAEKKEKDGYVLSINEGYIKKAKIDIYIPTNIDLEFKGNDVKIISSEDRLKSSISIDINNSSIDVKNIASIDIKTNNSKIDISNIEKIDIKGNNASININGKTPNINTNISNGLISIDNEFCREVNIKVNSGTVKVSTDLNNLELDLDLDHGQCTLDGERRINSGISKVYGEGKDKLKIEVDNGLINVGS
jgi:hypothetical protein